MLNVTVLQLNILKIPPTGDTNSLDPCGQQHRYHDLMIDLMNDLMIDLVIDWMIDLMIDLVIDLMIDLMLDLMIDDWQ